MSKKSRAISQGEEEYAADYAQAVKCGLPTPTARLTELSRGPTSGDIKPVCVG